MSPLLDHPQVRDAFARIPNYATNPCGGFKELDGHLSETECDFAGRCHVHEQQWRDGIVEAIRLALLAEWSAGEGLDEHKARVQSVAVGDPSFFQCLDRQHRARLAAERQKRIGLMTLAREYLDSRGAPKGNDEGVDEEECLFRLQQALKEAV